MLTRKQLKTIIQAKIEDAEALLAANRCDGAIYLCGYAVEVALKLATCKTLRWKDFPESRGEFQPYQSFKTHNLTILLKLSGYELRIKKNPATLAAWPDVVNWDTESRYKTPGTATVATATQVINSAKILVRALK